MAVAVEEIVRRAGGCAVIDGGFATQLEALGADINDPLWSAACLITKPHLIKEVTNLLFFSPRSSPTGPSRVCLHA
jgi:homocysteine S-methyltransferase